MLRMPSDQTARYSSAGEKTASVSGHGMGDGPVSTKRCARMIVADDASASKARQWKAARWPNELGNGSASDQTSGRPKLDKSVSSATTAGRYERSPLYAWLRSTLRDVSGPSGLCRRT